MNASKVHCGSLPPISSLVSALPLPHQQAVRKLFTEAQRTVQCHRRCCDALRRLLSKHQVRLFPGMDCGGWVRGERKISKFQIQADGGVMYRRMCLERSHLDDSTGWWTRSGVVEVLGCLPVSCSYRSLLLKLYEFKVYQYTPLRWKDRRERRLYHGANHVSYQVPGMQQ